MAKPKFTRREAKAMGNNAKGNPATLRRKRDLVANRLREGQDTKKNNPDNEEDTQIHRSGR